MKSKEQGLSFQRITLKLDQEESQPYIRGLRITVAAVVDMVALGMTNDEILRAYPEMQLEDIREALAQAFRELLMNAVEWGGKLDPTRKVRIACVRTKRMLLYRIADPGEGFDIDGLRHAAISNPEHDPIRHLVVREEKGLRPGGFGLAMTRSLVDELIYNEARNEVIFVKYLE